MIRLTEPALHEARAVAVVWSPRSVVSRRVRAEATIANRNKTLMPVTIEACERPIMFELPQTAALSHWTGDTQDSAWLALLAHTRQMVEARAPARPTPAELNPAPAGGPAAQCNRPPTIILPVANMTDDAEQEFSTDGVSEDIITDLAKVSPLSVVSRNTAFASKGKTIVAARIAQDLKVDFLLKGSVRKSGNRVRITAQLLDAHTDGHSHQAAKHYAERAVAADFNCAVAHASLAEAIVRDSISWPEFDASLAAALRLDPECFEAHLVGGDSWIMGRDFPEAIRSYKRAGH